MKKLLFFVFIFQLAFLTGCKTSQDMTSEKRVKAMENIDKIEEPNFTYTPNNALPMRGQSINLGSDFHLKVTKDTIDAYLPYYGRAYVAPMNPTEGGIKFTSTDFNYLSTRKKEGEYEIKIEPKDITNNQLRGLVLYLSIGDTGYASLNVQSTNRENISFYGTYN